MVESEATETALQADTTTAAEEREESERERQRQEAASPSARTAPRTRPAPGPPERPTVERAHIPNLISKCGKGLWVGRQVGGVRTAFFIKIRVPWVLSIVGLSPCMSPSFC